MRYQQNSDGDGDAAPEKFQWWRWHRISSFFSRHPTLCLDSMSWWRGDVATKNPDGDAAPNKFGDGDTGVLPSFLNILHYVWILSLGDAAPEIFLWWRWQQIYTVLGFYILVTRWHCEMDQKVFHLKEKNKHWMCYTIHLLISICIQ